MPSTSFLGLCIHPGVAEPEVAKIEATWICPLPLYTRTGVLKLPSLAPYNCNFITGYHGIDANIVDLIKDDKQQTPTKTCQGSSPRPDCLQYSHSLFSTDSLLIRCCQQHTVWGNPLSQLTPRDTANNHLYLTTFHGSGREVSTTQAGALRGVVGRRKLSTQH